METAKTKQATCGIGQMYLQGKIVEVEKFQRKDRTTGHRTRVMAPSLDEYSYPRAYDILDNDPLGKIGEMFEGVVDTTTFKADWKSKPDPETGEIREFAQINLTCYRVQ
jgi:hypothetical protein